MLDLIISERPDQAQVIMGTVSLHGLKVENGKVINLTEKKSVLRHSEFKAISESMRPYLDQMTA